MSDAKIETMVMITGREYEALRAEVAWHVEDKNKWQDTQAAHIREVTRLTAERDALASDRDGYVQLLTDENNKLRAENEKLRAALESIMVGGNSLAQIIGADHPPHGTPYNEALAHYGSGVKYEAWCCWNSIMQARAALREK